MSKKKNNEGVIKYTPIHKAQKLTNKAAIYKEISFARQILHNLKLIGVNDEGLGFGNISIRENEGEFLISGTQTGDLQSLPLSGYANVYHFDLESMVLKSRGTTMPSSEAVTHAVCYDTLPSIQAVIHIHSRKIWDYLLQSGCTKTHKNTEYGTQKLAYEVRELIKKARPNVIVLEGHLDGVIICGEDIHEALLLTLALAAEVQLI